MPSYEEAKQMHNSAKEAQRLAAERARRNKYNPDGTIRKSFDEGYKTSVN